MMHYNEGFFATGKLQPIFFRNWTPANPKLTVLYVHGAGGNSADGTALAQRLSGNEGCQVIAFDAPARGYSPANPGVSSFEVQRGAIEKIIGDAKTPIAVVASSGGAIATFMSLYLNRRKPEFSRVPVVLSEPSMGFDDETRRYLQACMPFFRRHASLNDAARAWTQSPFGAVLFDDESAKTAFIRGRLQVQGDALVPLAQGKNIDGIKPFDLLADKEALDNPALVLWGEKANLRARYQEQVDRVLKNQTTMVLAGAGHPLSLTRAVELNAIVEFLRRQIAA